MRMISVLRYRAKPPKWPPLATQMPQKPADNRTDFQRGFRFDPPPADTHHSKAALKPATSLQNLPFQELLKPICKDLEPPR